MRRSPRLMVVVVCTVAAVLWWGPSWGGAPHDAGSAVTSGERVDTTLDELMA
jgi:hypothetical protein